MFNLSNKSYDFIKNLLTIVFPAAATLYITISQLWWKLQPEVVGTASAVATFLGIVLKINTTNFAKENTMVPDSQIAELERSPIGVTLSDIASSAEGGPKALVLKRGLHGLGSMGGPHIPERIHDSCVGRFLEILFSTTKRERCRNSTLIRALERDIPLHWCHIY